MPFTLSHPAAVLFLARRGVPMAGLAAGAMVPDLPMVGPVPYGYGFAHSLPGIVTVDLLAGAACAAAWVLVIRGLVVTAAPARVRERSSTRPLTRREWLLLPAAVTAGALTHVVWDEFTHEGRWGARHVAWLADKHLGHEGYHWAQGASSVLGLAAVVAYAAVALRRHPVDPAPPRAPLAARWLVGVALAATAITGIAYAVGDRAHGLHAAAVAAAVHGLGVAIVAVVLAGAAWRLAAARTGPA